MSACAPWWQRLSKLEGQHEPLADLVRREFRANLAHIDQLQAESPDSGAIYGFAAKWAPWEFARARRLLRYVASLDLQQARSADTAGTEPVAPSFPYDRIQANLLWQTILLDQPIRIDGVIEARRWTLCYRGATELALAIEWWRLEHVGTPEKLDDLKGDFGPLPTDPYTKEPFLWFPWGLRLPARSKNLREIPAKTPLLYSVAKAWPELREGEYLRDLRREAADEPTMSISEFLHREGGGSPGGPQIRFEASGMAAGIGVPPSPNTPLNAVAVDSSVVHLEGLAFPIPNLEDELGGENRGSNNAAAKR